MDLRAEGLRAIQLGLRLAELTVRAQEDGGREHAQAVLGRPSVAVHLMPSQAQAADNRSPLMRARRPLQYREEPTAFRGDNSDVPRERVGHDRPWAEEQRRDRRSGQGGMRPRTPPRGPSSQSTHYDRRAETPPRRPAYAGSRHPATPPRRPSVGAEGGRAERRRGATSPARSRSRGRLPNSAAQGRAENLSESCRPALQNKGKGKNKGKNKGRGRGTPGRGNEGAEGDRRAASARREQARRPDPSPAQQAGPGGAARQVGGNAERTQEIAALGGRARLGTSVPGGPGTQLEPGGELPPLLPPPQLVIPPDLPQWGSSSVLASRQLEYSPPAGLFVGGLPRTMTSAQVQSLYAEVAARSPTFAVLPQSFTMRSCYAKAGLIGHEAFGDPELVIQILREMGGEEGVDARDLSASLPTATGPLRIRLSREVRGAIAAVASAATNEIEGGVVVSLPY